MKKCAFIYCLLTISGGLWTTALDAQEVLIPSGGQVGETSISIGQTVYLTHTGSVGTASEGVQQIDCPGVTAQDTVGCPGELLAQMVPQEAGGIWSIVSSIGSLVDSTGVVTLGLNTGSQNDNDTVQYLLNGCTTTVIIEVFPQPKVNAVNGGPYCAGELGHVYETGGSAVSWQWSFPGGFSSSKRYASVSPVSAGDYIVVATSANGCTNSDTTTVCVSGVATNCETEVDVFLGSNGTASFDPASLLGGSTLGECTIAGVVPQGIMVLSCEDIGGQGPTFTVSDSLGCEETCTTTVTVKDTTSPVDACQAMQEMVLLWEGTQVFASNLGAGSEDNCGTSDLEFSFSPNFNAPSRTVDCTEKLTGPLTLEIHMRDASGNVSSCAVTLDYAPESENCDCQDDNLTLNGSVTPADYKAKQTITSTGTISPGETVLYKAEQLITLETGFSAQAGSSFRARIDDCDATQSVAGADLRSSSAEEMPVSTILPVRLYPNPFANAFTLELDLPTDAPVNMSLHSLDGRLLRQLLTREILARGPHRLTTDISRLQAGVYMLRIEAGNQTVIQKVVKIDNSF